jgi:hypothetical protein
MVGIFHWLKCLSFEQSPVSAVDACKLDNTSCSSLYRQRVSQAALRQTRTWRCSTLGDWGGGGVSRTCNGVAQTRGLS